MECRQRRKNNPGKVRTSLQPLNTYIYLLRLIRVTEANLNKVKNLVNDRVRDIKDIQHGWIHLQRVANFAQKIVKTLKVENKIDVNVLLAACYLHDINHTFYSPGLLNYFLERKRLKKVLPKVLAELDIDVGEKAIIENAIYLSPFSFPFKKLNRQGDLYTKILQDADTLDFFSKQRELSFGRAKQNILFYRVLGLFSAQSLAYGRKNIAYYLNFPQISKELYVQKS